MRFQKPIVHLLAFLLLFSNLGLALNVHYCDDQIASVSLNPAQPSQVEETCCGPIEKASHCCKDRVVVLEKKSDQALFKSFSFEFHSAFLFPVFEPIYSGLKFVDAPKTNAAYYCDSHAPPLFKLYSQYIFYDAA